MTLLTFINTKMRLSSVYQPVIIKCLLEGIDSIEDISESISLLLHKDTEHTDYYIKKLKIHPKKVLSSHGIATIVPLSGKFSFLDVEINDRQQCIKLCEAKIASFLK